MRSSPRITPVVGLGLVTLTVIIALAAWYPAMLLLFFASILAGVFLDGAAQAIATRSPLGPRMSVASVLLAGALLFGMGGWGLARAGATRYGELARQIRAGKEDVAQYLRDQPLTQDLVTDLPPASALLDRAAEYSSTLFGALRGMSAAVSGVLVALIVGVYLAWHRETYVDGVVRLFPRPRRARVRTVLGRAGSRLRSWVMGRLLSMLAVGLLTAIALYALGIPLAAPLAVIAGLFAFVPFLGPIASVVPALLLAFAKSPGAALYVAIAYVAIQQVEGNLITPLIQQRAASVPPVLLLLGQALAGALFGLAGIVLATPAMVVGIDLVESLYLEGVLGEPYGDAEAAKPTSHRRPRPHCQAAPDGAVACAQ